LLCRERQANPDPGCYQWHWVSGGRSASLAIVRRSKTALLAIINNILDLASIDAGAMTLNLGSVDIRNAMEATAFYRHPPILPVLSPILPSAAYAPTSGTCDTPQKGRTKLTSYCTVGIS
jgi:hypothetical protein